MGDTKRTREEQGKEKRRQRRQYFDVERALAADDSPPEDLFSVDADEKPLLADEPGEVD